MNDNKYPEFLKPFLVAISLRTPVLRDSLQKSSLACALWETDCTKLDLVHEGQNSLGHTAFEVLVGEPINC